MAAEPFPALLRRYRLALTVTVPRDGPNGPWTYHGPCTQEELSRRSGLSARAVYRYESWCPPGRDRPEAPTAETVSKLADGLELDGERRARLLIAAGYWPWPELDDDAIEAIIRGVID